MIIWINDDHKSHKMYDLRFLIWFYIDSDYQKFPKISKQLIRRPPFYLTLLSIPWWMIWLPPIWFIFYSNFHHRHKNFKLYVDVSNNTPLFKKDATFNVRYGLGASRGRFGISFESVNYPGYFIGFVGKSFRLGIMKMVNTAAFKSAITWTPVTAQVQITHHTQIINRVQSKLRYLNWRI